MHCRLTAKHLPGSVVKLSPRGTHKNNDSYTLWSRLQKQKCISKINPLVIKALHNWVLNHYHLDESSCSNNCIKIKLDEGDKKVSVTKLYLQVPIKYLYDEMIKPPSLGSLDEYKG